MYCPNCGKENSTEQKFCRSCGLSLEKSVQSLAEQLPAAAPADRIGDRRKLVENTLVAIGGTAGTAAMVFLVWKAITGVILGRGEVLFGFVLIAFLLAAAVALVLVFYREFYLKDPAPVRTSPPLPTPDAATRQLTDPYFEPVPTVTEPTTNLLSVDKKSDPAKN